jgi:hypothetical protein
MPGLRRRIPLLLAATCAALAVPSALPTTVGADPYRPGDTGFDVSWPQCGGALPQNGDGVAVVGVTDGHPFSDNPCFAREWSWAATAVSPSVYVNISRNAGDVAAHAGSGPHASCSAADEACAAYDTGWALAAGALDTVRRAGASPVMWWLDVETADDWSCAAVCDTNADAQLIQGAVDQMHAHGARVGVYSNPRQWRILVGGWKPRLPTWTTAYDDPRPGSHCGSGDSFTGGPVVLVQSSPLGYDPDYSCGGGADVLAANSAGAAPAPAPAVQAAAPRADGHGYWLAAADGGVFPFGSAVGFGSAAGVRLRGAAVGIAATASGGGYWLAGSDGGVFPFGDAVGYGSAAARHLNAPVVGIAATPTGHGYWLAAADGGVFPFGDAVGYGSASRVRLSAPVVGIAATASGHGYWLAAADGGVFPFGDATGYGSASAVRLSRPVVGIAAVAAGRGYWLAAADGGVFPFGDAIGFGSTAHLHLNARVVGITSSPTGGGYWLTGSDGGVFPFGDAAGYGSAASVRLNAGVAGTAAH